MPLFPPKPGTAQRCDCHGDQVMAVLRPDIQAVEVRDRRHGTAHMLRMSLTEVVQTLDPKGTTVQVMR